MSTTTPRPGPPAGMPAHLWELAKRDVRGLIPDRLRDAPDGASSAPQAVRAVARRVASMAAVAGAAATIGSFADDPGVALAATTGPLPGELDPAPTAPGAGDATPFGHVSAHTEGAGAADAGLGSTWHVSTDDGSGHVSVMTVQLFQDVIVVENADGTFTVVADQVIRIVDPDGHEHVFHDHYETVVPDPPGQETDLTIHEDGHVRLVENPDGSFTPYVDHAVTITAGADGDGHDEVTIDQDETVSVHDHDPHHGDGVRTDLSETASSTSRDTGDEATSTITQDETVGDGDGGRSRPESGTPAANSPAASSSGAASTAASGSAAAASSAASSAAVGTVAVDALDPALHPLGSSLAGHGPALDAWRLDDPGPSADTATPETGSTDAVFTGGHATSGAPAAGTPTGTEPPTPSTGPLTASSTDPTAHPEHDGSTDEPDDTSSSTGRHPDEHAGHGRHEQDRPEHDQHHTDHHPTHDALDPAALG